MPAVDVQHYETSSGHDPIAEFLEAQPAIERAACDLVIERLADGTIDLVPRLRAYVGDGIWELRVSSAGKQYRFLYLAAGDRAFLLVAFIKKTPQLPDRQLTLAKKRRRELKDRGVIP